MGILATVVVASVTASAALVPSATATAGSLVSFDQAVHSVSAAQYYQYINVEAVQVEGRRIFDSISVGDTVVFQFTKVLSDTVVATESLDVIEPEDIYEGVGAADALVMEFHSPLVGMEQLNAREFNG